MIKTAKLALVALVTTMAIASPSLAQTYNPRAGASYYQAAPYRTGFRQYGRFNSDSPALTGGGSQGFNDRAHYDNGQ
jgi:hypothetical protein